MIAILYAYLLCKLRKKWRPSYNVEKKHIFFSTWPNRSSYSSFGKLISIFLRHSETSLVVQLQMLFDTLNKFGAIKSDSRSWNPWRTNPSSYVYIVLRRMKLTSAPISSLPYRNNCPENIRYFFFDQIQMKMVFHLISF